MQTDALTPDIVGSQTLDRFENLRNNSQQHLSSCNRVCKRTQHVTSTNFGSCWSTMLRPFARGLNSQVYRRGNVLETSISKGWKGRSPIESETIFISEARGLSLRLKLLPIDYICFSITI